MSETLVKGSVVKASEGITTGYTEVKVYEDGEDENGNPIKFLKQTLKLNVDTLQRKKDSLLANIAERQYYIDDIDKKLALIAEEE